MEVKDNLWLISAVLVTIVLTVQVSSKHIDLGHEETLLHRYKRVVGSDAVKGQWRWLVHLKADAGGKTYYCGGTIIARRWILTAAHCMDSHPDLTDSKKWHVTAGEVDWKCNNAVTHFLARLFGRTSERCHIHATRVIRHPDYKPGTKVYWQNDFALLYLEDDILKKGNTEVMGPCDLSGVVGEFPTEGDTGLIHGWGCSTPNGGTSATSRGAEINIRRNSFCENRLSLQDYRYNPTVHICAGGDGSSVCNGDSGGPLIVPGLTGGYCQAGVISWFQGSEGSRVSGFARVSAARDWIRRQTGV